MNLCFGIEILSRLDQLKVQKCQKWALLKWFYSLFWPSVKLCVKVGNNDTVDAFVMKKCWERIDGEGPENYYMNIE